MLRNVEAFSSSVASLGKSNILPSFRTEETVLEFYVAQRKGSCRSNPVGIIEEVGLTETKLENVVKGKKFRIQRNGSIENRFHTYSHK